MKSTIEQQNNKTMMKSASLFEHDLKVGLFIVPLRKVNELTSSPSSVVKSSYELRLHPFLCESYKW